MTSKYKPLKAGAFYSTDGSGNDGTFAPMAGSGGGAARFGRVMPIGLMYSSDGSGSDGSWVPVNNPSLGAAISNEYSNELGTVTMGPAANITKIWSMWFPYSISCAKIVLQCQTADNTANLYSVGFYDPTGNLVASTAPTAGTTFAPAVNATVTLPFQATCNLSAGVRYGFAMTGNAAIAQIYGTYRRWLPQNAAAPTSGSATSGAVLNPTITYAADSWGNGGGNPFLGFHN
jgi:hypothetical protein